MPLLGERVLQIVSEKNIVDPRFLIEGVERDLTQLRLVVLIELLQPVMIHLAIWKAVVTFQVPLILFKHMNQFRERIRQGPFHACVG